MALAGFSMLHCRGPMHSVPAGRPLPCCSAVSRCSPVASSRSQQGTCSAVGAAASLAASSHMIGSLAGLHSQRRQQSRTQRRASLVTRAADEYYQILGVEKGADKKAIKSAYRQKARKFHPDVNKEPGAEQKFKDISNAYEVLSDDQKRGIYDRYGEAGLKGGMAGGPGGASDFGNPFDIFEQFFGGGGGFGGGGMGGGFGGQGGQRRSRAQPGEDRRHDLTISFADAVFGCSVDIDVDRLDECQTCDGSGTKPGTSASTCSACGGAGQQVSAVRTPLGMFQQVTDCQECMGTGEQSTPCGTCSGDGRVRKTKKISLRVPAGVDTDSRLRVRGEGNAGRKSGPTGDLFVFINVRSDPELRREGTTIHSDVEISYVDAILGVTIPVRTVDGQVDLKIPGGTQPGTTLVMSKRGVPRLGSSNIRGDHQVHVRVKIPSKVKGNERDLVEQLKELEAKKPSRAGIGGGWPFGKKE